VIRGFIAIEIAAATVNRIAAAIEQLKPRIVGIRWVAPTNFHLTLKFLGTIDASQIDSIGQALTDALRPFQRFTINAKGLGVFPSMKRPRVLWVGLVGSRLTELATAVQSALVPLGFGREEKIFTPHLTIGRWRQAQRADRALEHELKNWTQSDFGATSVDEAILFESVLKPAGAIYNRLKVVTLKPDRVS